MPTVLTPQRRKDRAATLGIAAVASALGLVIEKKKINSLSLLMRKTYW
jgi:hypothetical protein